MLAGEAIPTDYLRVLAIPFADQVKDFLAAYEQVFVVETNRDGQLRQLLMLEAPEFAMRLHKIAHTDGLPLTARWIKQAILSEEAK